MKVVRFFCLYTSQMISKYDKHLEIIKQWLMG